MNPYLHPHISRYALTRAADLRDQWLANDDLPSSGQGAAEPKKQKQVALTALGKAWKKVKGREAF